MTDEQRDQRIEELEARVATLECVLKEWKRIFEEAAEQAAQRKEKEDAFYRQQVERLKELRGKL